MGLYSLVLVFFGINKSNYDFFFVGISSKIITYDNIVGMFWGSAVAAILYYYWVTSED